MRKVSSIIDSASLGVLAYVHPSNNSNVLHRAFCAVSEALIEKYGWDGECPYDGIGADWEDLRVDGTTPDPQAPEERRFEPLKPFVGPTLFGYPEKEFLRRQY